MKVEIRSLNDQMEWNKDPLAVITMDADGNVKIDGNSGVIETLSTEGVYTRDGVRHPFASFRRVVVEDTT